MLAPGLVSITFRALSPTEIIRLAVEGKVRTIEWGGDIHVPADDPPRARDVGRWTREAGLLVAAYGSYYRLGRPEAGAPPFERVLDTAQALGAPTIRVWAGRKGSAECPPAERQAIVEDALRVAEIGGRAGITISLEYHGGTLVDTEDSVRSLLVEAAHPGIEFLWQPTHGEPVEACARRLLEVLPRLRNVHVFHWWPGPENRHPLADGEAPWLTYIDIVRESDRTVDLLLEFVVNDSPAQFLADAETLRRFIAAR